MNQIKVIEKHYGFLVSLILGYVHEINITIAVTWRFGMLVGWILGILAFYRVWNNKLGLKNVFKILSLN